MQHLKGITIKPGCSLMFLFVLVWWPWMLTRKYISDVSVNASSKNRLKSILHDSLIIWQGWADKIHVVTSDAASSKHRLTKSADKAGARHHHRTTRYYKFVNGSLLFFVGKEMLTIL
jgi:hypothetical protein